VADDEGALATDGEARLQALDELGLGGGVQPLGRLVQQQPGGVAEIGAGEHQATAFAAGQAHAVVADPAVEAVWQPGYPRVQHGVAQRVP